MGLGTRGPAMFKEGSPIAYDAPADLKKWPSLNGQRLNDGRQPYLVFNGTLAVSLAEGQELTRAVRFANAAAAISVTRMGAQLSAPTRREIDRFVNKHMTYNDEGVIR